MLLSVWEVLRGKSAGLLPVLLQKQGMRALNMYVAPSDLNHEHSTLGVCGRPIYSECLLRSLSSSFKQLGSLGTLREMLKLA